MDKETFEVLFPGEIEQYVLSLSPSRLDELGTESWLEVHQHLQKLGQQAILEATEVREEVVKDLMSTHSKITVLVHEAVCVSVWREKVLPEMLCIEEKPRDTFIAYIVMFHEATAVTLLETVLYHSDSCEALGDSAVDLLDYCIPVLIRLASGIPFSGDPLQVHDISKPTGETLKDQESVLAFNIGMRCISILRYLVEFLDILPLSLTQRVYSTHDIPLLLVHLLDNKPWERKHSKDPQKTLKFAEGRWIEVCGEDGLKLTQVEGQVWIALRQLLFNQRCSQHYEFTDFRRNQLQKTQRHLTDILLDQLSLLGELKHFLCQLAVGSCPPSGHKPVVVEIVPEIRQSLLEWGSRRWRKLARKHVQVMFFPDQNTMRRMADCLNQTYDLNIMERLVNDTPKCAGCGDAAVKRCSRCKIEWYCGRECQVKCWAKHKNICNTVVDAISEVKAAGSS